ncbi:aminotransferase class V [candidate division MSBL1 archaeon SCGC-AAA382N08]|uniref:Aminotransferase class V n=1 Tax=candidate division MSBL1 archaeon SCGC-AAA382N08 TaxID=1698285 RepID=A0A133VN21_9EURY|nr:aminotransferase class V [candidate division MSBL1 archaeon SCGC-AAA382N08]
MLMTPGPTEIPKKVRKAMARPIQNPDIEEEFRKLYREIEEKVKKVYQTDKDVLIPGGEGILGLEASIASTLEPGDKVLCISNGIYGDEFGKFVEMFGGEPIFCKSPYGERLDVEKVKSLIEKHDFRASTMVHCETPTGTLNHINKILPILKENQIITIVDAVSSLAGTPVPVENIDLCIGGSQKCLSAQPGLTTVSVSDKAWETIMEKEQNTFYTNLAIWKETWFEKNYFPYTPLVSNIYGLEEALNLILKEGLENVFGRHQKSAQVCRDLGKEMGLELYPENDELCSPTVTAFLIEGKAKRLQDKVYKDSGILLATGLREFEEDILRIGHMGYNADVEKVEKVMKALESSTN